ncbi:pectinesterase inhibitor 4-like [Andrographis paniculata]|uniref:pectinesterase inhibitor 4-like n=1 Tax=Andrographis paniculata TaxID=175694 RepID=UPI0021E9996B|nr:pectinesterase inhibitor 4-like [Andrographis paniculata]
MEILAKSSPKHALTILALISTFALSRATGSGSEASKLFIEESCNTTTYPSLCLETLAPYAAVATSRLSLCDAALAVAIQAAGNCSAAASSGRKRFEEAAEAEVVKDCAGDLKEAVYELKETAAAMAHLGGSDREFQWSNAKTYASAAITEAETCVDGMAEQKVSAAVRKKMKKCVDHVEKLISISLALINHLY